MILNHHIIGMPFGKGLIEQKDLVWWFGVKTKDSVCNAKENLSVTASSAMVYW